MENDIMTVDDDESGRPKSDDAEAPSAPSESDLKTEVNPDEIKILLNGATNVYFGTSSTSESRPLGDLTENLPSYPTHLTLFKDPRHELLLGELQAKRVLLLSSYRGMAAYAAAYSLVTDEHFNGYAKRVLFPTRRRDRDRSDLDLAALADDEFLGPAPQIVLIEIDSRCTLLDSILCFGWSEVARVRDRLQVHSSYLIFVVSEDLLGSDAATARTAYPFHAVSHLRYLLAHSPSDRAEELERRLLTAIKRSEEPVELHELYRVVADRLAQGAGTFEDFVRELEELSTWAVNELPQPVRPETVFREESEAHCAVTFVATYFPGLGQRDFNRFVLLLLSDGQDVRSGSGVAAVHETGEEQGAAHWIRNADQLFRDCHLVRVVSVHGSWVIDFTEPYLRRELRTYLENHSFWYVERKCQALQDSGILFAPDLSPAAIDGLVRRFGERADADPDSFGVAWLLDVVKSLKVQMNDRLPSDSAEATLVWLLDQLALHAQTRAHVYGRLALLLREMLDRETLRPTVRHFFDYLMEAGRHEALLDLVLELARRLRFAPYFDPLIWLRRLFDHGNQGIRKRTANRLLTLARESGPRIYEFLAGIRRWLPEPGRPPERFSPSHRLALEFPIAYCHHAAASVPLDQSGSWPTRHPLFYALPKEISEARDEIAKFIEWLLDSRGEIREIDTDARPPEERRIERVADVIEYWFLVLTGLSDESVPEGRVVFDLVAGEMDQRLGERARYWLQQRWQRSQEDYSRRAAGLNAHESECAWLLDRRARLRQLSAQFANARNARSAGEVLS